jgi:signal transduction histidine kinase
MEKIRISFFYRQLIALVVINSIPLIFLSTQLLSASYSHIKESQEIMLKERLSFLSSTVASAIMFNDITTSQDILSTLRKDADVRYAKIYNTDSNVFSEYSRSNEIESTGFDSSNKEIDYVDNIIYLRTPIIYDGEYLGFVTMSADTYYSGYGKRLDFYLAVVAVIIGSLSLALLLNWFVQRRLRQPINNLIELVKYVSSQKKYDRQLVVPHDKDFSKLFIGLNEMLDTLHQHEKKREEASAQIIQSSKLATLGEMATGVAHELNQPLQVIRLAVANASRRIANGNPDLELVSEKLNRIDSQAQRASAIIDHMRIFGREAKEELQYIDPRTAITNSLDLMGEQLRLKNIEVTTELAQESSLVLGHMILIEQVMLNLLTNARDAIDKNAGQRKITLRVYEDTEGVYITSADTGGGIPEDVLPRIFEPFYTTKDVNQGTGLGLSVAYGIVRDMHGSIVAENVENGAQFTITLPFASD